MLAPPRERARPAPPRVCPEIGRRYLALRPEEADVGFLRAVLGPPTSSAARHAERVRADFADGRVVAVEGWVLSRTEARLSALEFLIAG